MSPQQIQQALMGLSPEYRKRFEDERNTFFNDTAFGGPLPDNFDHYRFFCGCVANECMLGISADNYKELFFSKSIAAYNIGNMVSVLTASEKATFLQYLQCFGKKERQGTLEEWSYMRSSFEQLTQQVNAVIEPAMEKIIRKLQALQHNLVKAGANELKESKIIPLG